LEPLSKRQILTRLLNNLKMIYLNADDVGRAWSVVTKMVHLNPDSPLDRRDRGLMAHRRNDFRLARDDLRFYLAHRPDAPDRTAIQASLAAIESILSMMG
jgi:regulator of sirC expression with transglutaminase-like and TPR domain